MVVIAKISKGSRMDQIYLPKNRIGMPIGQQVIISSIESLKEKVEFKPYYYGIKNLEPLKLAIIEQVLNIIERISPENVIITGSFLEKGFNFNDVDIIIIKESSTSIEKLSKEIENATSIKAHIIELTNKELAIGLNTDPLYQLMLSRCISRKRLIFKIKNMPNYRMLDLHLLHSDALNFDLGILSGKEKYKMIRNAIAIKLFIENKKLSDEIINKEIKNEFNISEEDIKNNIINSVFYKLFKKFYKRLQDKVIKEAGRESKQMENN